MSDWICSDYLSNSADELFDFIRSIRGKEMRSNVTFTANWLKESFQQGKVWIRIEENVAIVLWPDTHNIVRLGYYAKDEEHLKSILPMLPKVNGQIVCDIIGREPKASTLADELKCVGFPLYAKFQRMLCEQLEIDSSLDLSCVENATQDDAEEIMDMLQAEFDPLTNRLPPIEMITEHIKDGEVFVVRGDGQLAGCTIFSSKGKQTALWEYSIVRDKYRGKKIGTKMLHYKWKYANESQRYILWVDKAREGAFKHHKKNGFKEEGLYDYIFVI